MQIGGEDANLDMNRIVGERKEHPDASVLDTADVIATAVRANADLIEFGSSVNSWRMGEDLEAKKAALDKLFAAP